MNNNQKSIKSFKALIQSLPAHIKVKEDTFKGMRKNALFIDSAYGEFWVYPDYIRRGHEHPRRGMLKSANTRMQRTLKKYLLNIPLGITMDTTTYKGLNKKARFIDRELGEWWTLARHVLVRKCGHPKNRGKKIAETMLSRYGVSHNMHKKEFFDKSAKAMNRSFTKIHWRTGESLICVGTYECFIVDYLNDNKIDFKWQTNIFTLPDSRTYRPDLYLINENKWVEIKGRFWGDAEEKWDWFHHMMPNSELWSEPKLKDLGYNKQYKIKCLSQCAENKD